MPKKKDGEGKKRRTSSAKDTRSACVPSPHSGDLLIPPTPSATHLIASNPFDDPPSSHSLNNSVVPMALGPHLMMRSPPSASISSNCTSTTWGGASPVQSHRSRTFGAPSNSGWNANPAEVLQSVYQGMSLQQSPVISPRGYGYNRSAVVRPNSTSHQMPHCVQPRTQVGRFGEPNSQSNGDRIPVPRLSPSHFPMSVSNQMKMLVRQPVAINQNPVHQPLPNMKKSSSRSDKPTRNDGGILTPKPKRKAKTSEMKSHTRASSSNECEEKGAKLSRAKKLRLPSPNTNCLMPPHSVPPTLPQNCTQCHQDIKYPSEDTICCLASCNTWFHRTCAGLTEAAYNCLKSEELALWACDNCLQTKEINSIRLREPACSELPCSTIECNLPIAGKA